MPVARIAPAIASTAASFHPTSASSTTRAGTRSPRDSSGRSISRFGGTPKDFRPFAAKKRGAVARPPFGAPPCRPAVSVSDLVLQEERDHERVQAECLHE